MRNLSIRWKILIPVVSVVVCACLIISFIGIVLSGNLAKQQAFSQLASVKEAKAEEIELYFEQINAQILTFSEDYTVIEFSKSLEKAFNMLPEQTKDDQMMAEAVEAYYEESFIGRLADRTGETAEAEAYIPVDPKVIRLQYDFIANNANEVGEKHLLDSTGDDTLYSRVHEKYHPIIRNYLEQFGYYDIFIVQPESGHIMYSVFKEVDYGTSLLDGPYSDTGIASVFKKAVEAGHNGEKTYTVMEDFAPYAPSYGAAASFIASPVFDEYGNMLSVLIFQMPIDRINKVMTNDGNWAESGLGQSGEVYLVGEDYKLRSESRFLIEDEKGLLEILAEVGYETAEIDRIDHMDTGIGNMSIETDSVSAALSGESNTEIIEDYRGVPVLSAYKPLEIQGVEWAIIAEIDEAETMAGSYRLRNILLLILAIVILVAAIASFAIAKAITGPIEKIRKELNYLAETGDLKHRLQVASEDEIGAMASSVNDMLDNTAGPVLALAEKAKVIAENDLTVDVEVVAKGDIVDLVSAFQGMVISLRSFIDKVKDNAAETMDAAQELASSSEEVAASVEEVASTMAIVLESTKKVSGESEVAGMDAEETNQSAESGRLSVEKIDEQMMIIKDVTMACAEAIELLGLKSENIGEIIDTINGISEQTNLLALNASIEAARAGEAGRGFAVVADEIRKLAEATKLSTVEISTLVHEVQNEVTRAKERMQDNVEHVEEGSSLINQAVISIDRIPVLSERTSGSVKSIGLISDKNVAYVEQVSVSLDQVTSATEEVASVAMHLTNETQELTDFAERFKTES